MVQYNVGQKMTVSVHPHTQDIHFSTCWRVVTFFENPTGLNSRKSIMNVSETLSFMDNFLHSYTVTVGDQTMKFFNQQSTVCLTGKQWKWYPKRTKCLLQLKVKTLNIYCIKVSLTFTTRVIIAGFRRKVN